MSISHLGYWADNGAYYCLVSEPNTSYEQTMVDVATYLDGMHVPVHYFQLGEYLCFCLIFFMEWCIVGEGKKKNPMIKGTP